MDGARLLETRGIDEERFVPNPFQTRINEDATGKTTCIKPGMWLAICRMAISSFLAAKMAGENPGFASSLGNRDLLSGTPACASAPVTVRGGSRAEAAGGDTLSRGTSPCEPQRLCVATEREIAQHMVPSAVIQLPLAAHTHGKTGCRALPEPGPARPQMEKKYSSPREEVEQELTRIWGECLGVHLLGSKISSLIWVGTRCSGLESFPRLKRLLERNCASATIFRPPRSSKWPLFCGEERKEGWHGWRELR